MQKRAKVGGETGVNGEFYEGGKFLPSTERPKGKAKVKKPGKQQVEPYRWELPPEGKQVIFHRIVGTVAQITPNGLRPFDRGIAYFGNEVLGHTVAELCERYNAGERWF